MKSSFFRRRRNNYAGYDIIGEVYLLLKKQYVTINPHLCGKEILISFRLRQGLPFGEIRCKLMKLNYKKRVGHKGAKRAKCILRKRNPASVNALWI
jgi:hypothetical protein